MAIVNNMWLKGTRQKLGGTVLYQSMGRTLQRELAPAVSNPRTPAQMSQRVLLANVVALYRISSSWMRGAFESKPQNQTDYNAFVSANLSASRVALTKAQAAAGAAVVAPYRVAMGSLNPINWDTTDPSLAVSDIYLGNLPALTEVSVANFAAAVLDNNNIPEGSQLSLIQYIQQVDDLGTPYVICRPYEVLLDRNNPRPLSDYMPRLLDSLSVDDKQRLAVVNDDNTGGFAMILSKTTGSRIQVSPASIILTQDQSTYNAYTTAAAHAAAVESYSQGADIYLSSSNANPTGTPSTAITILSLYSGGTNVQPGGSIDVDTIEASEVQLNLSTAVDAQTVNVILYYYNTSSQPQNWGTVPGSASGTTITFDAPASTAQTTDKSLAYVQVTINGQTLRITFTDSNVE